MPADEHLGLQFEYHEPQMGRNYHILRANLPPRPEGRVPSAMMSWNARHVTQIDVPSDVRRQGVATALWNEGQRLAEENARIPKPKHSTDRTDEGDAWAKAVGGRLPRRKRDAD